MAWIQIIGWMGQGAFFGRSLLQWTASERSGRSVIPAGFWALSLAGAVLLLVYAAWRRDPVILLGQSVNLAIYLRNISLGRRHDEAEAPGRRHQRHHLILATLVLPLGIVIPGALLIHASHGFSPWNALGWLGQFIFLTRFPYQWWHSESKGHVEFSAIFWWLSLSGSLLVLIYALKRHDLVIFTGQAVGLLAYGRNLWLQGSTRHVTAA